MEKNYEIEYLAPHLAQYEFNTEKGVADSLTGAAIIDLTEDDTYSDDGEWL